MSDQLGQWAKLGLFFLIQTITCSLAAQSWDFINEQDGIKIYARQEPGRTVKAFKGVTSIQAPAEKVYSLLEDVNHIEWWPQDIIKIKVLGYEKDKSARYYLVYHTPWPVSDRDLCVEVTAALDKVKQVYSVTAVSIAGVVPEDKEMVRIKVYRQSWTITSTGENSANVILEGYADPAGNIPVWLTNMVITQAPLNAILGVRQKLRTL